jgi:hypothetical protein
MNTLDRTLELFASREPDAATVTKRSASSTRWWRSDRLRPRFAGRRAARGWLAAGASAAGAAVALLWLPLGSTPALAFAQVQQHFPRLPHAAFRRRATHEWRGRLMKSRIHVTRDGNVRTDVGDLISVIVNSSEHRVMTLHHPRTWPRWRRWCAGNSDDAMAWLKEIREFQGEAKAIAADPDDRPSKGLWMGARDRRRQDRVVGDGRWIAARDDVGGSARCSSTFEFEFDPDDSRADVQHRDSRGL